MENLVKTENEHVDPYKGGQGKGLTVISHNQEILLEAIRNLAKAIILINETVSTLDERQKKCCKETLDALKRIEEELKKRPQPGPTPSPSPGPSPSPNPTPSGGSFEIPPPPHNLPWTKKDENVPPKKYDDKGKVEPEKEPKVQSVRSPAPSCCDKPEPGRVPYGWIPLDAYKQNNKED